MQRADRHRGRRRRGERELLLNNIILAERDDKEDAKEARARGERNKPPDILLRELGEQVQAVHGGDRGHEEDADPACRGRGGLDGAVLFGAKGPAEEAAQEAGLGEGLGERLDDGISEDGLYMGVGGNGDIMSMGTAAACSA